MDSAESRRAVVALSRGGERSAVEARLRRHGLTVDDRDPAVSLRDLRGIALVVVDDVTAPNVSAGAATVLHLSDRIGPADPHEGVERCRRPLDLDEVVYRLERRWAREVEAQVPLPAPAEHGWIDASTGLPGRPQLDDVLERAAARARRHGESVAVVLLRPDGPMTVSEGDADAAETERARLEAVAEVLRREVRIEDVAGRWDGDTFEVVAVGTGSRGAIALAERLRRRASLGTERHDALEGPLRLSLGVAAGQDSATRLVRRALLALGEAQSAGGNRVATS